MKRFFPLLALVIATTVVAQPPDIMWTMEVDYRLIATVPAGGFIAVNPNGLVRLDEDAGVIWTQPIPHYPYDIIVTMDGGFVSCGEYSMEQNAIQKVDADGSEIWMRLRDRNDGNILQEVDELSDSTLVVSDHHWSGDHIVRYTASGEVIEGIFGGGVTVKSMEPVDDGLVIAGSDYNTFYGTHYYQVSKYELNTGQVHSFTWYNNSQAWANSVIQLANGMYLSSGNCSGNRSILVHNPNGSTRLYFPFYNYDHPYTTIKWPFQTADQAVVLAGGWGAIKLNHEFDRQWYLMTDFELSAAPQDLTLANDGGMVFLGLNQNTNVTELVKYAPEATVNATSDTQTVPPGIQTVYFDAEIGNILLEPATLDVWSTLYPPEGDPIVASVSPNVTLIPGETLTHPDSLVTTPDYPAGHYLCRVHVGDYEHEIVMGAGTFEFEKLEATSTAIAANGSREPLPDDYSLIAHPNPFNAVATLTLSIPEAPDVRVVVYATTGQQVATLHNGPMNAGVHTLAFDASGLASGVYLFRVAIGQTTLHRKLVLVR